MRIPLVAAVVIGLASVRAGAADVVRGDVVRSAMYAFIMCPAPPPTALYSGVLAFKGYLEAGDAVAFDSVGNLYSVRIGDPYSVNGPMLLSLDPSLSLIRSVPLPEAARGLAVDAAGFSYVVGLSGTLYVYSPGGMFQRRIALPNLPAEAASEIPSPISIDVTPNGCTLIYIGADASVNRYDTSALMPLAGIASDQRFDAIRALNDGGFAGATGDHILFYDASGRLAYGLLAPPGSPIGAMAFDVDPQYLWIANQWSLVRMRISDHTITAQTDIRFPRAVAVFGEHRPDATALPTQLPKRRAAGH
jgi:hypothetical protein